MSTSPTATGSLAKTPFPQLIVYLADRALTGSLVLRALEGDATVEHTVHFDEGAPVKVRTGRPVAYLGDVLVEIGMLDEDGLEASRLSLAASGGLHGELLLRTGRIDRSGLMAGLREQVARKMAYLFTLPKETTYAFFEGTNLLEDFGGPELVPVDPLKLVWNAVCASSDLAGIDELLKRLGKAHLRLRADTDLSRFAFDPAALPVIDQLQGAPRLEELLAGGAAPEHTIKLVVFTLTITRHLDLGPKQAAPLCANQPPEYYRVVRMSRGRGAGGQAAVGRVKLQSKLIPVESAGRAVAGGSVPAASKANDVAAQRESIFQRAAAIDKEDYFTMLGVGRDAAEDAIRAAYVALAKRWHPDRLSSSLGDARDAAGKVFSRIHEAFETLVDPEQRKRYLGLLQDGGGTPEEAEQVQKILDAADDFQRAQVFYKKRDTAQAELHAERAMKGDPDQADYVALWAMLQLEKRATDSNASVADLLKLLDDALAKDANCERALMCRGNVLKRIGRVEAAMSDFRKVVELYPKNIDAAREIRLHEMRQKGQSAPKASESAQWKADTLLGKLFKR